MIKIYFGFKFFIVLVIFFKLFIFFIGKCLNLVLVSSNFVLGRLGVRIVVKGMSFFLRSESEVLGNKGEFVVVIIIGLIIIVLSLYFWIILVIVLIVLVDVIMFFVL